MKPASPDSRATTSRRFSIELCALPQDVNAVQLRGKTAVAVDVLRAATTIATALSHGATHVIPCEEIEQARKLASATRNALLGGERRGELIEGFDLANSPSSYTAESVSERPVIFTSTNGTRALAACDQADCVVFGSFVNLSAVGRWLQLLSRPVVIVCAGTNGEPTLEDMLFGGALCQKLAETPGKPAGKTTGARCQLDPPARACQAMWETAQRQIDRGQSLAGILGQTQGGRNLLRLGLQPDIEFASQVDLFDLVPCLDEQGRLVAGDVDHLAARR